MSHHYPPMVATTTAAAAAAGPSPSLSSTSTLPYLGQTRSRTLLFLSYRDSVAPTTHTANSLFASSPHPPYSDNDDPLASSLLDDSERHGLLPSSHKTVIDMPSDLPPKWMDISDQVDSILVSIRPRMDQLARMHEIHLRPGFTDKTQQENHIEALALAITKDFRRCSHLVAGLASFIQLLIRQAKRPATSSHVTIHQISLAQNVQTALATKVQNLSGAFRKQQSLYLRRMKGMQVRDRDIRAARGLAPSPSPNNNNNNNAGKEKAREVGFKDSELAVREDIELSRQQLSSTSHSSRSNLLLLEEQEQEDQTDFEITNRSREINGIAKSIQELAQLFGDLQTLVIDQGTMLDRIDYNVEMMATDLESAVEELHVATSYQRKSGKRLCILFLLLCIALLIAILIIKPFWRVFFSDDPNRPDTNSLVSPH